MSEKPKPKTLYPYLPSTSSSAVEESRVQRGELEAKVDAVKFEYDEAKQSWEASLRRINTALEHDCEGSVGGHDMIEVACLRAAALKTM